MASKGKFRVLRDSGLYEDLYPLTTADLINYKDGTIGDAIDEVKSDLGVVEGEISEVSSTVSQLGTKVTALNTSVSNLNSTVTSQGQKISTLETKVADNILTFSNVSVAASAWKSNSTYADFPFRASVTLKNCTSSYIPDVYFGMTEATSGIFAPVAETYSGGVYIWASEKPNGIVIIPSIKLIKNS